MAAFLPGLFYCRLVTPSTTHVWMGLSVGSSHFTEAPGFVIFQTGNPNASSYRIKILYETLRVKPRPDTCKSGLGLLFFFQVRVIAGVYRPQGIFNVLEPLRVGAGLEDFAGSECESAAPSHTSGCG